MSKANTSFLFVEDAVARMINLDFYGKDYPVLFMTAAFLEEAEMEYDHALSDVKPEEEIAPLRLRANVCLARHELAHELFNTFKQEIEDKDSKLTTFKDLVTGQYKICLESLSYWTRDRYGIEIPVKEVDNNESFRWDHVTIKIYKDYKIRLFINGAEIKRSNFSKIGLKGVRRAHPNKEGKILIRLSEGKAFPITSRPTSTETKDVSELNKKLMAFVGLTRKPLLYREEAGYFPLFTLIDDRDNADKRAEERALISSLDSEPNKFIRRRRKDQPADKAQKWLDEHDKPRR